METEEAKELKKIRAQEQKKEKAAQANKLLKVYRKLDTLYVERKKVLRQHSPPVKEIPRVPPSVSVERDPNRVLRHTRVWQAHCLTKPTHIKPLLHVRNLPHLAVPDWRKGVL
ncbi:hypothetical protein B566_EDAN015636 [Ephemera danica]|nr:hypothetical protein B566_EDAN015636 [Ephemera danica]